MRKQYLAAVIFMSLSSCVAEDVRDKGLIGVMIESNQPSKASLTDYGLTRIVANPSVPANQAFAICEPQAMNAKRQASAGYSVSSKPQSYNCNQDYWGNYDCSPTASGGAWAGINEGLGANQSGRAAYDSVLDSCLASYGWSQ